MNDILFPISPKQGHPDRTGERESDTTGETLEYIGVPSADSRRENTRALEGPTPASVSRGTWTTEL